jgi:Mlc titration factor MtfA (ptsG expression regulator)
MINFFSFLTTKIRNFFVSPPSSNAFSWQAQWSAFLLGHVVFYRVLSDQDKTTFEQRCLLFMNTTRIEAGAFEVSDEDRLLVAASAIIPVWGFPKWHYFNLAAVFLLPGTFNRQFECGQADSTIAGMVGSGPMSGKMALSRPHLHLGYKNSQDKSNVGIHEFVHLLDMADGRCDGMPEDLHQFESSGRSNELSTSPCTAFSTALWFDFISHKINEIDRGDSNIGRYGATNQQEFFAVASEYFFERPKMLKKKHPQLFDTLTHFYRQNVLEIEKEVNISSKAPCPWGSGKRYKRCCMPKT